MQVNEMLSKYKICMHVCIETENRRPLAWILILIQEEKQRINNNYDTARADTTKDLNALNAAQVFLS